MAGEIFGGMLGLRNYPLISSEACYYLKSYGRIFVFAAIGATPLLKNVGIRISKKMPEVVALFCVVVIGLATAYLIDGSFNPFLYFRF